MSQKQGVNSCGCCRWPNRRGRRWTENVFGILNVLDVVSTAFVSPFAVTSGFYVSLPPASVKWWDHVAFLHFPLIECAYSWDARECRYLTASLSITPPSNLFPIKADLFTSLSQELSKNYGKPILIHMEERNVVFEVVLDFWKTTCLRGQIYFLHGWIRAVDAKSELVSSALASLRFLAMFPS